MGERQDHKRPADDRHGKQDRGFPRAGVDQLNQNGEGAWNVDYRACLFDQQGGRAQGGHKNVVPGARGFRTNQSRRERGEREAY